SARALRGEPPHWAPPAPESTRALPHQPRRDREGECIRERGSQARVTDVVIAPSNVSSLEVGIDAHPANGWPHGLVNTRARESLPELRRAQGHGTRVASLPVAMPEDEQCEERYTPRSPEQTLLHRVVREQLEPFLARARARERPAP